MQKPLVSIITPTFGRQAFLPALAACVRSQSYQNIEWLILDDSEMPSSELTSGSWDKLRYIHSTERLSVGEKRNKLIELSTGDVVAHFDDDDFYGPNYLENALSFLTEKNLDFALSSGFFVAHLNLGQFGYYRTRVKKGAGFAFNKNGVAAVDLGKLKIPWIHLCYGWSYVYRRSVWDEIKFGAVNVFEDREFVRAAQRKFHCGAYESRALDCIHSVHYRSSSQCFPQFLIPRFVIESLSPEAARHVALLKEIAAREGLAPMDSRAGVPDAIAMDVPEVN